MFKNPFSFKGRIRRTEFWLSCIILYIPGYLIYLVNDRYLHNDLVGLLILSYSILMIWLFLSQSAKRCHDLGVSGWFQIIPFYIFLLLFSDSKTGPNNYGLNPKGIDNPESDKITIDEKASKKQFYTKSSFKMFIKIALVLVIIIVLFQLLMNYFEKKGEYYNSIRNTHSKMYYYYIDSDTSAIDALFIKDLIYKDSLINFYKKMDDKSNANIEINFKSSIIPKDTAVYILEYLKVDTNIVKVLFTSYYYDGNTEAYIYSKLLHKTKYTNKQSNKKE